MADFSWLSGTSPSEMSVRLCDWGNTAPSDGPSLRPCSRCVVESPLECWGLSLRPSPRYLTGCVTLKYLIPKCEGRGKRGSQRPSLWEETWKPSPSRRLLCRKWFISQLTKAKRTLSRVRFSLKATGFNPLCPPAIALNELEEPMIGAVYASSVEIDFMEFICIFLQRDGGSCQGQQEASFMIHHRSRNFKRRCVGEWWGEWGAKEKKGRGEGGRQSITNST